MTDQYRQPLAQPPWPQPAAQWPQPAAQWPGARPAAVPGPQTALAEIRQLLFRSVPETAMAHSYHVEALLDPALRDNQAFQRFSAVELNELHHQVAALGCLYRLQQGDPQALTCLAANLQGFLDNRQLALQLAAQLPAAVRQNPSFQAMRSLIEQTQQEVQRHMPAIQRFEASVAAPNPGAMLVGPRPGDPLPH